MELLTRLFSALGYKTPASQVSTEVVLGKMALDQFVFAPAHMLYYMHMSGWLDGRSREEIGVKVSREFWPILVQNWKVWPLVSFINFKLVPPQLRVLTLNVVGVFWMVFLIKALASAAAAAAAVKK
jgi:protein Mpv17